MLASAGPGPTPSALKQWKLDGRVKIYNSVSARLLLTKSKNKKIESRNIKSARVSALMARDGLSATQKCHVKWMRDDRGFQLLALTTEPWVHTI